MWTAQGWNIIFGNESVTVQKETNLLAHLSSLVGYKQGKMFFWWIGNKRGLFKVSAILINRQPTNWPWKHISKTKTPHEVACFVWLLTKEATLTQDNLMRRGIPLCSRLFFCGEMIETHLWSQYTHECTLSPSNTTRYLLHFSPLITLSKFLLDPETFQC